MRILMPVLHYSPVIGGLEAWTENIARGVLGKANVFIVTGKVEGTPQQEEHGKLTIFRTSLYPLKDLSFSSPFYIFSALPFIFLKSLNLVRKEKIDLLHCQGFLGGLLGYGIYKLQNIPYIVTVQKLENKKGFLRKLAYQNAKICIVASSAIKKYFGKIGARDVRVVPNGIHLNKFKGLHKKTLRRKLGFNNEFLIITVGRLEIRKGFKYLIEAIKFLEGKLPRATFDKIKLLIIGDGVLRGQLEAQVRELSLGSRVIFLGSVPNEKIQNYLGACDCFVLSSLEEGFGIAILEAMASGLPVVGSRVGGILDIIEDEENGLLVEPENSKKISEAIYRIYTQPKFARRLVKKAFSGLEKYNWKRIVKKVEEIYLELT